MPKFTVGIFVPEEPPMHVEALEALAQGFAACGVPHFVAPLASGYRKCDVTATFGVAKQITLRGQQVGQILARQKQNGGLSLVIERGFLHRQRYYMVGWGGLNGRADFQNENSPGDRWDQLGITARPWRKSGRHIVLSGQVPWDASVQHTDHIAWCRQTALRLRERTDRPILFRPHPCQPEAVDMTGTGVTCSTAATLEEDLQEAWALVSYNSNAGVEAALLGIPPFAADEGSMAYGIANRDLAAIESPAMPDRTAWLNNLAYTQWTLAEIAAGQTWRHLQGYAKEAGAAKPHSWWRPWSRQRAS